ncbi:MAG TPA: TPM domain-containing protein [Candidatus Cloacimonadota bacterium]|nr:TPM domain-containing protein [Candidatus Cloacimonadota bacterium]
MTYKNKLIAILLLVLAFSLFSKLNIPEPVGFVNDFAKVMSEETVNQINDWCIELKEKTDVELAIGTFESVGEAQDEKEFAVKAFEQWKVGNKKDEGILIIMGLKERRLRIEVGYGAEGYITDSYASRVYREMAAMLTKGSEDWDGAFTQGSLMLISEVAKEKGVTITGVSDFSKGKTTKKDDEGGGAVLIVFFIIFIFLIIITRGKILAWLWAWFILSGGPGSGGSGGSGGFGGGSSSGSSSSSSGGFGGFGGFGGGRSGGGGAGGGF